jgi:hypothetical protein
MASVFFCGRSGEGAREGVRLAGTPCQLAFNGLFTVGLTVTSGGGGADDELASADCTT